MGAKGNGQGNRRGTHMTFLVVGARIDLHAVVVLQHGQGYIGPDKLCLHNFEHNR